MFNDSLIQRKQKIRLANDKLLPMCCLATKNERLVLENKEKAFMIANEAFRKDK